VLRVRSPFRLVLRVRLRPDLEATRAPARESDGAVGSSVSPSLSSSSVPSGGKVSFSALDERVEEARPPSDLRLLVDNDEDDASVRLGSSSLELLTLMLERPSELSWRLGSSSLELLTLLLERPPDFSERVGSSSLELLTLLLERLPDPSVRIGSSSLELFTLLLERPPDFSGRLGSSLVLRTLLLERPPDRDVPEAS
jgi:hypothetical protein